MPEEYDFESFARSVREHFDEALSQLGKFNLILFGDSGAGKSTLVNTVFGVNQAVTGVGDAVTQNVTLYRRHEDDPLGIYDCPGFEVASGDLDQLIREISKIVRDSRSKSATEWVHAVWFVVNHRTNRFLSAHGKLVQALAKLDLPVFLVLTHVVRVGEVIEPNAVTLAKTIADKALPLAAQGQIFLVNSMELDMPGGAKYPVHGVKDLLDATVAAVPEAARLAALAAQRIDLEYQRKRALEAVEFAQKAATVAQLVPIPGIGATGFAVVLSHLIVKISVIYGVPLSREQIVRLTWTAFLGGAVSAHGATWLGKELAKKLGQHASRNLPMVGPVLNAANVTITRKMIVGVGHAWIAVCEYVRMQKQPVESMRRIDLIGLFARYYQERSRLNERS